VALDLQVRNGVTGIADAGAGAYFERKDGEDNGLREQEGDGAIDCCLLRGKWHLIGGEVQRKKARHAVHWAWSGLRRCRSEHPADGGGDACFSWEEETRNPDLIPPGFQHFAAGEASLGGQ